MDFPLLVAKALHDELVRMLGPECVEGVRERRRILGAGAIATIIVDTPRYRAELCVWDGDVLVFNHHGVRVGAFDFSHPTMVDDIVGLLQHG